MMRGDVAALRALYQRHGTTVYALAYGMLVDSTGAEEVVAETFAYAWEAAARWVGTANQSVSGWLKDIARSRARGLLLAREWPGRLGSVQSQRTYVLREEIQ
jgi:RNA polymerase sigma-70 factor (ECF subfamily)